MSVCLSVCTHSIQHPARKDEEKGGESRRMKDKSRDGPKHSIPSLPPQVVNDKITWASNGTQRQKLLNLCQKLYHSKFMYMCIRVYVHTTYHL